MAAVTAAVVAGAVVAGGAVMSAKEKKKGAEAAADAFKNVGKGIEKVDLLERSISQFLGGPRDLKDPDNRYREFQERSYEITRDQMAGQLSEPTRALLGRRALETGAVGLGRGAVQDAYTGYLGLTTEQQVQTGFANYRAMFSQLGSFAQQQQAQNYSMQYNTAAQKANVAMMKADANAGMWQGIAQGVSMAVGGIGGAAGGGASAAGGGGMGNISGIMSMFGGGGGGGAANTSAGYSNMAVGGQYSGPSSVPSGYQSRNVSQVPPGI